MKSKIFILCDEVSDEILLLFTAKNEQVMNRNVKQAMAAKQPSPFNTDVDDKKIYLVGELDHGNRELISIPKEFVVSLTEVREDLLRDIRREKARLESVGIKQDEFDNSDTETSEAS